MISESGVKPDYWEQAVETLIAQDRVMRKLIPLHQEVCLSAKQGAFVVLARALIVQRMSAAKSQQVWTQFKKLCGNSMNPAGVLSLDVKQLNAAGVTKLKAECLLDLAESFANKKVQPTRWSKMADEEIIAELTTIRGIGIWTAQMFLIFNLHRPDVLPYEDPRLVQAISTQYFSGEPVSRYEIKELAENWAPWRTVATWYLWCSLNAHSTNSKL